MANDLLPNFAKTVVRCLATDKGAQQVRLHNLTSRFQGLTNILAPTAEPLSSLAQQSRRVPVQQANNDKYFSLMFPEINCCITNSLFVVQIPYIHFWFLINQETPKILIIVFKGVV